MGRSSLDSFGLGEMMNSSVRALGALAMIVVAFSCVAQAQAAKITIGSPMTAAFEPEECTEPCSIVMTGSGDPNAVIESPVNGEIVAWRMRQGSPAYKYALRVFTPSGPEEFTGAGTSAAVSPAGAGLETFPTLLPVHVGQLIGIDLEEEAVIGFDEAVGSYAYFAPPLADGETLTGLGPSPGELAFNAEILPPPTISSLGTTTGPTTGGTPVAITGTNFSEVKGVSFGSSAATYNLNSESLITATAPVAAAAGPVPVTLTTVAGSATASQTFTYVAPAPGPEAKCQVPKLKGKKLKAAKRRLRRADCKLGHVGRKKGVTAKSGKVVKQRPKPGTVRQAGSKVSVKLG
jgi:hypothetical protein